MAKQTRLSSKRVAQKPAKSRSARPVARAVARTSPRTARRNGRSGAAVKAPPKTDTHVDAIVAYQRGVEALQTRDIRRATQLFQWILAQFPDEKELQERVRLYLNICERQAARPGPSPRTTEERIYG